METALRVFSGITVSSWRHFLCHVQISWNSTGRPGTGFPCVSFSQRHYFSFNDLAVSMLLKQWRKIEVWTLTSVMLVQCSTFWTGSSIVTEKQCNAICGPFSSSAGSCCWLCFIVSGLLLLETSAFKTFHGGNSTFINSFDKTKFLFSSFPQTQHHSFFRTSKSIYCCWLPGGFPFMSLCLLRDFPLL